MRGFGFTDVAAARAKAIEVAEGRRGESKFNVKAELRGQTRDQVALKDRGQLQPPFQGGVALHFRNFNRRLRDARRLGIASTDEG